VFVERDIVNFSGIESVTFFAGKVEREGHNINTIQHLNCMSRFLSQG